MQEYSNSAIEARPISSLIELSSAVERGMPIEVALAFYYSQRTDQQLAAEYKECAQTTARWEEAKRPDQVTIQRTRLVALATEIEKRKEVDRA